MMRWIALLAVFGAVFVASGAPGASAQPQVRSPTPDAIRARGSLVCGVQAENPPFSRCPTARACQGIAAIDPSLTSAAGAWDTWQIRGVTPRHIDDAAVALAVAAFRAVWPAAQAA